MYQANVKNHDLFETLEFIARNGLQVYAQALAQWHCYDGCSACERGLAVPHRPLEGNTHNHPKE